MRLHLAEAGHPRAPHPVLRRLEQRREHHSAVGIVLQTLLVYPYGFPKGSTWDIGHRKKM